MAETVRLTVFTGPHQGRRFCFRAATECLVGRGADCFVHLCGTDRDKSISRHHCQLAIDPPLVRVQDLGSLNGTFINGRAATEPCQDLPMGNVRHGDIITIGGTSFRVEIVDCPPDLPEMHEPVWQEGEVAKSDCPVPCSADACEPFLGCCVGGLSAPRTS